VKSLHNLARYPAALPLLADDLLEFHAARLLLLLKVCGTGNRIDGLTKMAKLDFFVRYPEFFERVARSLSGPRAVPSLPRDSSMIRFHYGPWDPRYYHVLSYLEAKGLIGVERDGPTFRIRLTSSGAHIAEGLESRPVFAGIVAHMKSVKKVLGRKAGSTLRDLVYRFFGDEVGEKRIGEVIT
jgi:hypothetical protein